MRGQNIDIVARERPPVGLLRNASLFLDFDGTLVEIASTPDAVQVEDHVHGLLASLAEALDGRVAILSGRPAGQIRALLPMDMIVAGSHGSEIRRRDGWLDSASRPSSLDGVIADLKGLKDRYEGVIIEEKPLGVAVHYRLAPEATEDCEAAVLRAAESSGLAIQRGKMVLELKIPGTDKGTALGAIMGEAAFRGSVPVMLGDDLTDEPAFRMAQELGGAGILVGAPRDSEARFGLDGVSEALEWLSAAGASAR